jgi:spore coat polysaccharide biosynthesis predicted glycosyltransferase SpsG
VNRYLYRVTYTLPDGSTPIAGESTVYEPVCVRAATEADALAEVTTATTRYLEASGATRTMTLVLTTADV